MNNLFSKLCSRIMISAVPLITFRAGGCFSGGNSDAGQPALWPNAQARLPWPSWPFQELHPGEWIQVLPRICRKDWHRYTGVWVDKRLKTNSSVSVQHTRICLFYHHRIFVTTPFIASNLYKNSMKGRFLPISSSFMFIFSEWLSSDPSLHSGWHG